MYFKKKKMNRIIYIFIITFTLFNVSEIFAQKNQVYTQWQTAEYNKAEEVSNMDFLFDSKTQLLYRLTNDQENLYIHARAIDEQVQRKLLGHGFNVEIKIKGDKQKRSIDFPLNEKERMQPVILLPNNTENRRNNFHLIKKQVVDQIYVMKLTGFKDKEVITAKCTENELNIIGKLSVNSNDNLQYLMTIPLKSLGVSLLEEDLLSITLSSTNPVGNDNNEPADGEHSAGVENPTSGNMRSAGGMGNATGTGNYGGVGDYGGMGSAGGVGTGGDRSQGQGQRAGAPADYAGKGSDETDIKIKLKNVMLLKAPQE